MILADTAIWIDFLDRDSKKLSRPLEEAQVLMHPFIIGELAMGNLRHRQRTLLYLSLFPEAQKATDSEVLSFVNAHALHGRGIGYVDAHLLVSTKLTTDATLMTTDKRLHSIAEELGLTTIR